MGETKAQRAKEISSRSLIKAEEADAAIADAAGTLFHLPQFVEQFVVQALVPLSIIYLVIAHSWAAAANVLSVPRPFSCVFAVIFLLAQLISMMPIVVFLSWILRGNSDGVNDASTSVLRVDIVAVAAAFVMHRLAISIKYAYQPTSLYTRRMTAWVTYQERLDDQLFASWFKLSRATIEREVSAALETIEDEDASASYSLSPETFARLRAGVNKEARVDLDSCATDNDNNNYRILPAGVLASVLLVHVNEETSGYVLALQRLTSLIGLVSTFSSTVLRAALSVPILGTSTYDSCVIIAAWISNFLLLPTIFTFIAVGVVDHARRKLALETLSRLLQPSPLRSGGRSTVGILASAVQPAVLPLETVSNVRAFLAVRSLLLAFGAGFHARLVTVISGDLIVLAIVTVYCVISALTASTASGLGVITASLVLHHSLVVPAVALCALGLYMASEANTAAFQSTAVIAQTRLFMRVASGTNNETPPPVFGLLDDVEKVLRENAEPITILGIAATPVLTNSLVGGFFSVETLLVSGAIARLSTGVSSSSTTTTTSSPSSSSSPLPVASASASPLANSTSSTETAASNSSSNIEINVGIFFGIVTALSIVIAVAIMIIRRRSSSSSSSAAEEEEKEKEEFKSAVIIQDKGVVESIKVSNNPMALVVETVSSSTKATEGGVNEHNHSTKVESTEISSAIKTTSISADWVQHEDTSSGEVWFENVETGETVWELPSID